MSLKDSSASLLRLVVKGRNEHGVGFTLVELLVVIAIAGTLSGIAIPVYTNQITNARNMRAISEIRMLEKRITVFEMENQALPITLNDIGRGTLLDPWDNPYQYLNFAIFTENWEGDADAKEKGNKEKNQKKQKAEVRKDRWEKPLNSDYDLYSMGKNGESMPSLRAEVSRDDIIRAYDGGFVGLASEH